MSGHPQTVAPQIQSAADFQSQSATVAEQAAEAVRAKARAAGSGGRQSTILTSPLGVVNTAPVMAKTLLGS